MGGDNYTMGAPGGQVSYAPPAPTPQEPQAPAPPPGQQPMMRGMESPWGGGSNSGNPFLQQYGQDVAALYPATMAAQGKNAALDTQASLYGGTPNGAPASGGTSSSTPASNYPAYPNQYGLGNTNAFTAKNSQPTSPQQMTDAITNPLNQGPTSDGGSRGFNPWSLTGEANSRS